MSVSQLSWVTFYESQYLPKRSKKESLGETTRRLCDHPPNLNHHQKTYAQTGHMCCNNLPKIQPGFDMSPDFHSAGHVCCHRCAVPALLGTRPLCFNNAVERGADDAVEGRAGGVSDAHHEQVWVRNMFGQVKNSWDGFWLPAFRAIYLYDSEM